MAEIDLTKDVAQINAYELTRWPNFAVSGMVGATAMVFFGANVINAKSEHDDAVFMAQFQEQNARDMSVFYSDLYSAVNDPSHKYQLQELQPDGQPITPQPNVRDEQANRAFNSQYSQIKSDPEIRKVIDGIKAGQPIEITNTRILTLLEHADAHVSVAQQNTAEAKSDATPAISVLEGIIGTLVLTIAGYYGARRIRQNNIQRREHRALKCEQKAAVKDMLKGIDEYLKEAADESPEG
jgi:hypothetical protein